MWAHFTVHVDRPYHVDMDKVLLSGRAVGTDDSEDGREPKMIEAIETAETTEMAEAIGMTG